MQPCEKELQGPIYWVGPFNPLNIFRDMMILLNPRRNIPRAYPVYAKSTFGDLEPFRGTRGRSADPVFQDGCM